MTKPSPISRSAFKARAVLVGERIDLRGWASTDSLGTNPLTVEVAGGGVATLHRYGVIVFFNVAPIEEVTLLSRLRPQVGNPIRRRKRRKWRSALEPAIARG